MSFRLMPHYFQIAVRRFARKKLFTCITIGSLALSIGAAIVIADYAAFEKSFDRFHANADRIYRVTTDWNAGGSSIDKRATTVQWSGPGAQATFPEVEAFTRVMPVATMTGKSAVQFDRMSITGPDILVVDSGFFKVFSFHLLEGDPITALHEPGSVVISETMAARHFPGKSPIGKDVFIDTHGNLSRNEFTITGVISDAPENSHLRYDFLISHSTMWEGLNNGSTFWHWDNTYCYLLLHPDADPAALGEKMSARRVAEFSAEMTYYKDKIDFHLQPLTDIHLHSALKGEISVNGNSRYVEFLLLVAIVIVLAACINYINLSLASTAERQSEIGIRKISGSSTAQLLSQLGVEALIAISISILLGLVVGRLSIPLLEEGFDIRWPGAFLGSLRAEHFFEMAGMFIVLVSISLAYPAAILRWVQPAVSLKGNNPGGSRWSMRRYLIVAQFVLCIALTTGGFVIYRQMNFIMTQDPGFERDEVIVVRGYGFQKYEIFERFGAQLSSDPEIISSGMSSASPGDEIVELSLRPRVTVHPGQDPQEVKLVVADDGFFETLQIPFIAGRNFDRSQSTEKNAVIVNEAAARMLGYGNPEDILLAGVHGLREVPLTVVGVIRDYHQLSFHQQLEPIVYMPAWSNPFGWDQKHFFIRISSKTQVSYDELLSRIAEAWSVASPEMPFSYFFLDDHFARQYKADLSFTALFTFFSGFALFIMLIGLVGVVAQIAISRTREIAVRKVLGAAVAGLLALLSRDFLKHLAVASSLAIPIVILLANEWLQTFAFRIRLNVWILVGPVAVLGLLTLMVVVLRSYRVAAANPVEGLRHE
jgi:putative ABC transport system permease protein